MFNKIQIFFHIQPNGLFYATILKKVLSYFYNYSEGIFRPLIFVL